MNDGKKVDDKEKELLNKIEELEATIVKMTPPPVKSMDVSLRSKHGTDVDLTNCRGFNQDPNTGLIDVHDEDEAVFHLFNPQDFYHTTVTRNYK